MLERNQAERGCRHFVKGDAELVLVEIYYRIGGVVLRTHSPSIIVFQERQVFFLVIPQVCDSDCSLL